MYAYPYNGIFSAVKKKQNIDTYATTWMNLGNIILKKAYST